MNKVSAVKVIAKAYFFGAIAISFIHLVEAARKGGLNGYESYTVPFMIDGIAIIGLIMRGKEFSMATRKTGFKVQVGAGALSLAGNVFAAHNLGGAVYGIGIVLLFLMAEWLSDNIKSADVDRVAEQATKRQAAAQKAAATRKRNARQAAKVVKTAETFIK